jgi:hypothetical protein
LGIIYQNKFYANICFIDRIAEMLYGWAFDGTKKILTKKTYIFVDNCCFAADDLFLRTIKIMSPVIKRSVEITSA